MNSLTNCEYRTCFFVFAGCGETACPVSKDILPHDFKRIPSDMPRGEYFSVYFQVNIVTRICLSDKSAYSFQNTSIADFTGFYLTEVFEQNTKSFNMAESA